MRLAELSLALCTALFLPLTSGILAAQQGATAPPAVQNAPPVPLKMSRLDLDRAHDMLRAAFHEVQKHYYDPTFHGIDLEARYKQYDARIDAAPTLNAALRIVAAYLDGLKDSHTFFIPPMRPYSFDPGFRVQMIGDQCFVTRVRPGTDAATKLKPGDHVASINSFAVNAGDLASLLYYFNELNPSPVFELGIKAADGTVSKIQVKSLMKRGRPRLDVSEEDSNDYFHLTQQADAEDHVSRSIVKVVGDVVYWRLPEFEISSDDFLSAFGKIRKHDALVLDLRGDPGGAVEVLRWMVGGFFDHPVKIADTVTRNTSKTMMSKSITRPFTGRVFVLVDSGSSSAAELFARVMQLEHRATVIGDKSSGLVMESRVWERSSGMDVQVFYDFSVTEGELIMTDGKSLEKTGVLPDDKQLPNASDLADGRDPVLAYAGKLAGGTLTPEDAGKMFPIEWVPIK